MAPWGRGRRGLASWALLWCCWCPWAPRSVGALASSSSSPSSSPRLPLPQCQEWSHRPHREAAHASSSQMPPRVLFQGGPFNIEVQQANAQRVDFMPQQLNGRMPEVQHEQWAPQLLNGRMPEVQQQQCAPQLLNGRMPDVQQLQCAERDISLTELHQPSKNHERNITVHNIGEEGLSAPPLRRSERIRAQKEAEKRVQPLQTLRRSARIQAKKETQQREVQQLRRSTRIRTY